MVIDESKNPGMDKEAQLLNVRQKSVLKGVCEAFISTGIPVGSRTISKIGDLVFSPATIRNEMADLESMGYLFSPHTSAGRVPTEKGYRFYVNFLIKYERLSQIEETLVGILAEKSEEKRAEQEKILRGAVRLACDMTKLGGILLIPQKSQKSLRSIQLIRLLDDRILLVTVDECGQIDDQVVMVPPSLPDGDLARLSNLLNDEICNRRFHEMEASLLKRSHELLVKYNALLRTLTERIRAAGQNSNDEDVVLEGFVNFFDQAEFKDPEKMREMIRLLDRKEQLLHLLAKSLENGESIMVNIGSDSGLDVADLSIVTARYSGPNQSFGRIGLIGPLRMNYGRVVSTLANISQALSGLFLGAETPRSGEEK